MIIKTKSIRNSRLPWFAAGLLVCSLAANAQESTGNENEEKIQQPERMKVTGSRIKRQDTEGTAPITVIDREEIEKSGVTSVAELLRNTVSSPTGNFSGSGGYVRSGAATVDLLGIGSSRTLVLLDGKRLPVDVSLGAVNVDNIPIWMIERIELLTGGASAIYGADAVGGVVNIITKKDTRGTQVSVYTGIPENGGGEVKTIDVGNGVELSDNLRMITAAGYTTRKETLAKNRDYKKGTFPRDFTATLPPAGQYSYRVYDTTEGAFGPWQPSPDCPAGNQRATVPTQPDNVYCAGPRANTKSWIFPRATEWYVTNRMEWDITDQTRFSSLLLFNEKKSEQNMGNYLLVTQHPIKNLGVILSGEKFNEINENEQIVDPNNLVELYAESTDFENRWNVNTDRSYGGTIALESFLGDVDFTTTASYYVSTNRRDFLNVYNKERLINLLFETEDGGLRTDPDYIPIDPNRDRNLINTVHDDLVSKEKSSTFIVDAYASTELFELPGGPLSVAVGTSFQSEAYEQTPDLRDRQFYNGTEPLYTGTAGVAGDGAREVYSVFAEAVAPLGAGIEIDAAIRLDNYSDFGSTTNYSLGPKWKVTDFLALRGNAATSFKAPTLDLLHAEGGGGYVYIQDEDWCTREREERNNVCEPGGGHQIYADRPGNENLQEEVGQSYSIGFILEPFEGLDIVADYFGVVLRDRFGSDSAQDIADAYYEGQSFGDNKVLKDEDGIITSMAIPTQNLGRLEVYAAQTDLRYMHRFDNGLRLNYNNRYFRYFSYKVQDFRDSPLLQYRGYKGTPNWRMSHNLSLGLDMHNLSLNASTIAKQQEDPENIQEGYNYRQIDEFTQYDLAYSISTTTGLRVTVGVNNILDEIGGLDDSGSVIGAESTSSSLYSLQGRTFFTSISQRF